MYVWSSHVHPKDCTSVISLSWRNRIILLQAPISILWGLKVLKVSFCVDFTHSEFGLFIVRGFVIPSAMDSLYKGTAFDTRPPVISGFSTGGYWSDTWEKTLVGKRNPSCEVRIPIVMGMEQTLVEFVVWRCSLIGSKRKCFCWRGGENVVSTF
jgi:hypothetical protein